MEQKPGAPVQGTGTQAGTGSTAILAAAGTGNRYHIDRIIICISVHQDTGVVSVTDGTTVFVPAFLAKDDNGSVFTFDFGPKGWVSAANAAISLVVATAAVTAGCTIMARKVGNDL
jgi:hypothetical protein